MKKISAFIVFITVVFIYWMCGKLDAFAANSIEEVVPSLPNYILYDDGNWRRVYEYDGDVSCIYWSSNSSNGGFFTKDGVFHNQYKVESYSRRYKYGDSYPSTADTMPAFNIDFVIECSVPVFLTSSSAQAYANGSGSLDDAVFAPEPSIPDWDNPDYRYDFGADEYNKDIPVPQIYNVGYDSFWIDNKNGYAIDLVVDLNTFRLVADKKSGQSDILTYKASSSIWESNHYNFTIANEVYMTNGAFPFAELYSVDVADWYYQSLLHWLESYPKLSSLDGFGWLSTYTTYSDNFYKKWVADVDARLTKYDGDKLKAVEIGFPIQTVYYVRFYDSLTNTYGQWGRYVASSNPSLPGGEDMSALGRPKEIESAVVEGVSVTGKPIVTNNQTVKYDYTTDDYVAKVDYEIGDIDWNVSISNLKNVTSMFGAFPSFVAVCFSFLPEWITALVGGGISICVALAIYHAIRG